MSDTMKKPAVRRRRGTWPAAMGAGILAGVLTGCSGQVELPTPRPLVVRSGARVFTDRERMQGVDEWIRPELENVEKDPSFLIEAVISDSASYPWESLEIEGDTARISLSAGGRDAWVPLQVYSHLHLMARRGQVAEWYPEAAEMTGYELEKAILSRTSDAWLYARSIFDAAPYGPLDELLYANESGYLDAMIFMAQGDRYPEARDLWVGANPERFAEYRTWFQATFAKAPPGSESES